MFTVCSKCNLRLTVTATDLRAAQGYVRCGRCHNVFNALAALADDPARPGEAEGTATATQSRPALTPPEPQEPQEAREAQAPEPAAPAATVVDISPTDTQLEFNPASTNINEVFIEAIPGERTGTFESIILVGEDPAAEGFESDPVIAPQALSGPAAPLPVDHSVIVDVRSMRDALAEPDLDHPVTSPEVAVGDAPDWIGASEAEETSGPGEAHDAADTMAAATSDMDAGTWALATTSAESGPAVNEAAANEITSAIPVAALLDPEPAAARRSRLPRWALRGAVGVLVLCLVGQVVHHYRLDLADTSLLQRPLTALYQSLGQPLQPRWNIANYEIRQLGATTDGVTAGELVVRASIANRATRDQPLPLLRVVMQDRFGNRVAARDLKPAEYLGPGAPQVSLMAPGQRVDAQVVFQDPGQAATGFEIDACMAGNDGTVTCANDPGRH